jgi:MFS family permease
MVGTLSDRLGRKPILIISLIGIAISYGLWFFAGSFSLLVAARLLGGVMSGNIATATAVVADVTKPSNRSKGMALIGIAFGLGFIIGPAMGAFSTLIDLTAWFPSLKAHGVNPFSTAALLAFVLSIVNLWMVITRFKETLPKERRRKKPSTRSINPINLFKVESFPGVSLNNLTYFYFLLAFSGMEFTLTFLTFERLQYNNVNQGMMFVFIGFVLVMMQGGYVRRKAPMVGERKMAAQGMAALIPGLAILAFAQNNGMLYLGLFLMAFGSAQVIPCLTTLASRYAPDEEQGRVVGVFRSLGALARAIGPLLACFLYWKLGSFIFYIIGASFVIVPLILCRRLPEPPKVKST